ncbi:helix-turn-helix transcriptional regulator [Paenibacillus sp. FSL H8-0537]|uniref:helix-turn-helix transcriptional regulator n=1 Tax=Paenibacillus sp. FSL H8-0537 TaxID=2921399 RepID=UPI003100E5DA
MSHATSKAKTLGHYLKSRRDRILPEQAGFSETHNRRRTQGLRREEVAMLAGVSTTYYTWLEQGRDVTASKEIIESIGRALQLTSDEETYLMELWNPHMPEAVSSLTTTLNPQWQDIIGQLSYPSFISNEKTQVLAWNEAASVTIADFASWPDSERIMLRLMFLDEGFRRRLVNWEEFARFSVAVFRTYYDKHQGDPWFKQLIAELLEESKLFEEMWEEHHIQLKKAKRVTIQTPGAKSPITYDILSIASIADQPGLFMCIYAPNVPASLTST